MKLPIVQGAALRLVVALAESPITAPLIVPSLLKNAGVLAMRKLRYDDPPTYLPLWPHDDSVNVPDALDLNAIVGADGIRPRPTQSNSFRFHTVRDFADAYRSGRTTPVEVAERVLAAIAASDQLTPPMRAFIAVNHDDLMRQACESAERIARGAPLSIFDGVPVAVKDEVDMVPYPTTGGTAIFGKAPAREDSHVVAKMRAVGAILIGKTNMYEIGMETNGTNPHHGAARNPYNPAHDTGGSSSGSGAAVGMGLAPVAIGADGGGSIRIPAAFNGGFGLKATFGRISEYGALPICWSMAHIGPIAASAEDTALAHAVMAGRDPRDPNSMHQPPATLAALNSDLRGLRIGIYTPYFEHAHSEVVAACRQVLDALVQCGAQLCEVTIPELYPASVAYALTIATEMLANVRHHLQTEPHNIGLTTRLPLAVMQHITAADYLQAQRIRTRHIRHFREAMRDVDVIATPTAGITAPRIVESALPQGVSDVGQVLATIRYAFPGNLTGLPAISIPAGYDSLGLPIGIQFMAHAWREDLLLRLAYEVERIVDRRKPMVWYDLLG